MISSPSSWLFSGGSSSPEGYSFVLPVSRVFLLRRNGSFLWNAKWDRRAARTNSRPTELFQAKTIVRKCIFKAAPAESTAAKYIDTPGGVAPWLAFRSYTIHPAVDSVAALSAYRNLKPPLLFFSCSIS